VACFADGDKNKQSKPPYRGSDLIVCSIDEVKSLYSKFQIYISVFGVEKFSIMDFIINKTNIDKQHILNYEPYEKRLSCKFLESCLHCSRDIINLCYYNKTNVKLPQLFYNNNGIEAIESVIRIKNETIAGLQNETAEYCKNCLNLRQIFAPVNTSRINNYCFSSCRKSICNLKCFYCVVHNNQTGMKLKYPNYPFVHAGNLERINKIQDYKHTPEVSDYTLIFTKYLEENEIISPEWTFLGLSDGEITVTPNRKDLFNLISRYCSQISTNSVIYSEEIAELLATHKTRIITSVDAGTRETFAEIKEVDAYNNVKKNLIEYGKSSGNIILKYIFIPGINDDDRNLDGFLELCKEVNILQIRLSIEYNYDYSLVRDGYISNILNFAEKCRTNGFLIDALDCQCFNKAELDMIMGKNNIR